MPNPARIAAFTVSVELPDRVTREDMAEYITVAVQGWRGGFDPNNPLFDLDKSTVKVKVVYPPARRKT